MKKVTYWQEIIPTSDGNMPIGKPLKVVIRFKSITDYEEQLNKILDKGLWVEVVL